MTELTICMSVYNGEKYLPTSIGSLLGQTLQDFKLLVYDDGSKDNTLEVIESFHDDRFRIMKGECNRGVLYARTRIIPLIDTEYCMWLDDDDFLCRDDALEHGLEVAKSKDFDVVTFARMKFIHKDGTIGYEPYHRGSDFEYFGDRLFETHYPTPMHCYLTSKVIRSSILKRCIPEDEIIADKFSSEDSFFSTMLFFLATRYCHIESEPPIYAYNSDIGVYGSKRDILIPSMFNEDCKVSYHVLKSMYNRMTRRRDLSQTEINNLVKGVHFEELFIKMRKARERFGNILYDELQNVWNKWFCADGIHILNGFEGFAMPEHARWLKEQQMR